MNKLGWTTILLLVFAGLFFVSVLCGVLYVVRPAWVRGFFESAPSASDAVVLFGHEEIANSHFTPEPTDLTVPPVVESIPLPDFDGATAIWGATGRDTRGHIWFGISATPGQHSAHLYEYIPEKKELIDRGDVLTELKRNRLYRYGEGQMKIHSRIVQGADGHLYFASMDEEGEDENGGRLPTWGSHFWRLRLPENRWEHLFAAPEGLIAVASGGSKVYALGYFDHVLYQFDCQTRANRSVHVGSVDGHISRNFVVDARGHVYVPRLRRNAGKIAATLVEFNEDLQEIGQTPLRYYLGDSPTESHGIVAFQHLADETIVFATHTGRLYWIAPLGFDRPASVMALGNLSPTGPLYIASMFTCDGKDHLFGVEKVTLGDETVFRWVVFDRTTGQARALPLALPAAREDWWQIVLYGSMARDNQGAFYVGGHLRNKPVLYRLRYRQGEVSGR
jgi:hypothetical protein